MSSDQTDLPILVLAPAPRLIQGLPADKFRPAINLNPVQVTTLPTRPVPHQPVKPETLAQQYSGYNSAPHQGPNRWGDHSAFGPTTESEFYKHAMFYGCD